MKRRSIRRQFALIFISLMAAAILLSLLVNKIFLKQYYTRSKYNVIRDAYETIREEADNNSYGTREFVDRMDRLCLQYNIRICIVDIDSRTSYASDNGGKNLEERLLAYLFGFPVQGSVSVIEATDDYVIQRNDSSLMQYLEMYGRLDSGISFLLQTSMESIEVSAEPARKFFAQVGFLLTILGGVLIWLVTGRITKPISKLSEISERMVRLDFDARYEGHSHNEIDQLGENINLLAGSLEQSISELKTANNELKKDIEQKEKIDEMRREFLANVSHELKTPIALIQGYAEGLVEGVTDDPESRKFYCDVIADEAAKMNQMVQKLLKLNELEFGGSGVAMERFDVVALVRNYIQSADILAKQNEIRVRLAQKESIFVWADEFMTEDVFGNYFSNAVHHCEGEKLIDIRFEQLDKKVRVCVFNTGKPIPEDCIAYIWEKFYKVDKARTREYGGSGVGLSIVKAMMNSMNQEFGVENFSNGVMFWFELETVSGDCGDCCRG